MSFRVRSGLILFALGIWFLVPSSAVAQTYQCVLTTPAPAGNAAADAQLHCDAPGPCNALAVTGLYLTNQGSNWITVRVDVTYVDENGNTGTWSQPIGRTLSPHGRSDIFGCAGAWCDIVGCTVTPPESTTAKAYLLQYRVEESDITDPVGNPTPPSSCSLPPALQKCSQSTLNVGTYHPRGLALLAPRTILHEPGGPLCINVIPDTQEGGGTFVQDHCDPNSASQQFILESPDIDNCFHIRIASSKRLVITKEVSDSKSELFGWGDDQITQDNGGNCQSTFNRARWGIVPKDNGLVEIQNKQTGACINATADNGYNFSGAKMQTLGCETVAQGLWSMDSISVPVAPQLTAQQAHFLTTRTRGRRPGPGPRKQPL